MTANYELTAGLDIGNGFTKGYIENKMNVDEINIPSCVSATLTPQFHENSASESADMINEIYDRMRITIDSANGIISKHDDKPYCYTFGNRAMDANQNLKIFKRSCALCVYMVSFFCHTFVLSP